MTKEYATKRWSIFSCAGVRKKRAPKRESAPEILPEAEGDSRRYATGIQTVANQGAQSILGLWRPEASSGQLSLSQQWIQGGVAPGATLQTAEAGWQVCPDNYPNSNAEAVFFIFWTPDDYASGAYDNTDGNFKLKGAPRLVGGVLDNASSDGGVQYEMMVAYALHDGGWWLAVDGDVLGYWPLEIYNGGALSRHAEEVRFGGEVYSDEGDFPPMGSGEFAAAGYRKAAYHRNVTYIDLNGTAHDAALQPLCETPASYTVSATPPPANGAAWGSYFYFGGPGGP